ncbi:MAG: hypothetical protein Q9225_003363 [Loekoesia sp. 1 TL-2023]
MTVNEAVRVLETLKVLRNVSGDRLKPHKSEILLEIRRLKQHIKGRTTDILGTIGHQPSPIPSKSIPTSCSASSSSPAPSQGLSLSRENSVLSPKPEPNRRPPQKFSEEVQTLMQSLKYGLTEINEFVSETAPVNTTYQRPSQIVDARITNAVPSNGVRKGYQFSKLIRFRRGLSQRSLALEYKSWKNRKQDTSSVNKRAKTRKHASSWSLNEFLRNNRSRFGKPKPSVHNAIRVGIKLLGCEQLLGNIGYSPLLIFHLNPLRELRYE